LEIHLRDMKSLFRFAARDVSAGGVFIETRQTVEVGGDVEVTLRHPVSGEDFSLEGRVVRVENKGLAVEFTHLDDGERRALQRFIITGRAPEENG
jgi:Tfp pilus assembly protein PilZ